MAVRTLASFEEWADGRAWLVARPLPHLAHLGGELGGEGVVHSVLAGGEEGGGRGGP